MYSRYYQSAVTLIELLVVIAIIGIIALPMYISYTRSGANQALRSSGEQLSNDIRLAHVFAREAKDKKGWGVKSESKTSYSQVSGSKSNFAVVKTFPLEPLVEFPDEFSLWFTVGTGELENPQSIVLTNKYGKSLRIDVEKTGIVSVVTLN